MICIFICVIGYDYQKLSKCYPNGYVGNSCLVFVSVKYVQCEDRQSNDVEICEHFHGINEPLLVNSNPEHSCINDQAAGNETC